MKKIVGLLIILILGIIFSPVIIGELSGDIASANPNKCPQGQVCKWVQHEVTNKCQWLPQQAVANPWKIVPEGTCPQPVEVVVVENTKVVVESTTTKVVKKPTSTQVPVIVVATVGKNNDKVTVPTVTPFSFIKSICDTCYEEQRQANSQETVAAVMATQLSIQLTSVQLSIDLPLKENK